MEYWLFRPALFCNFRSLRLFLSRQPARDRVHETEFFGRDFYAPRLASPVDNKFTAVTLLIPRKIQFSLLYRFSIDPLNFLPYVGATLRDVNRRV